MLVYDNFMLIYVNITNRQTYKHIKTIVRNLTKTNHIKIKRNKPSKRSVHLLFVSLFVWQVCREQNLVYESGVTEGGSSVETLWLEKVLQLHSISNLNHGLMMVGPSGSGKSTAWRVLLRALDRYERKRAAHNGAREAESGEGVAHVIDPKAISKVSVSQFWCDWQKLRF